MQRFLAFAFAFADVLIEVDGKGDIALAMGAGRALFGVEDAALVGRPFLDLFDPLDRGMVEVAVRDFWPGARRGPVLARAAFRTSGRPSRKLLLYACRLPGQKSAFSCTLSLAGASAIARMGDARVDPENGLLDEHSFVDAAGGAVKAARAAGEEVGMSLIDIPELSALTKRDPTMGERLIRRVGDLLRASSLDGSAAGRIAESRFGVVTRVGGDDMARCVEGIKNESRGAGVDVDVSVTSVRLTAGKLSDDDTIKAVRFAVNRFATLPKGEAMGPHTVDGLFERMMENTRDRMASFVRVIRDNEFALTYQPIVEIATAKLHHFEVLTRFGDGGSPFDTIKFAEEIDLIARFDIAVVSRSISEINRRLDSCPGLAVNLSGRSVTDPVFTRALLDIVSKHPALAGRLGFEITESSELKDLFSAAAFVRELRGRGFSVHLDDFGAGAAGFSYIQSLDVDGVKIDGEYIGRLTESRKDHTILVGMVRMCRELGLETVAERVETRDTAIRVHEIGIRYGQGWYYGRPLNEPVWFAGPGHPVAGGAIPI